MTTHTVPDPANFALEEDDTIASKCKRVHAFGCRDLRDPGVGQGSHPLLGRPA